MSQTPQDPEQRRVEGEVEVGSLPAPTIESQEADEALRPKTVEETKERVRGQITGWTIFTFIVTILLSFVGVFTGNWDDTKDLLMIIVPLEATLIGGIAGYYLGTGKQV